MIPDTLPTQYLDRALFALRQCGQMVVQIEFTFAHSLDAARLARAVDLVMNVEPILGCRLSTASKHGAWIRLASSERCGFASVEDEASFKRAMEQDLDPEIGPLIMVTLLSRSEGDRMLIKVAHEVADAAAAKRIVLLLSSLYLRLALDPKYSPRSNVEGSRSIEQLTRQIPWTARPTITVNLFRQMILKNAGGPCQAASLQVEDQLTPTYLYRVVQKERTKELIEYGRHHHATLNDVFVTAFLRSIAAVTDWKGDRMLSTVVSVDLRRYLPAGDTGGICNLSAVEEISLGRRLEPTFEQTLHRIAAITGARKKRWIGLSLFGSGMLRPLRKMSLQKYRTAFWNRWERMRRKEKLPPALNNAGSIPELNFDGVARTGHFHAPAFYSSALSFVLSGYRGTLTLSTVAYPKSRATIEALMQAMLEELPCAK